MSHKTEYVVQTHLFNGTSKYVVLEGLLVDEILYVIGIEGAQKQEQVHDIGWTYFIIGAHVEVLLYFLIDYSREIRLKFTILQCPQNEEELLYC